MATQIPQPQDFSKALKQAFSDLAAGKVEDAEPVLRNALKFLPEETTVNNECMAKLGQICTDRGDYSDAIRLNLRLLDQLRRRLGENNQPVFESMEQLATLYENSGRFEEAAYMHKRAQAIAQRLVEAELTAEQEAVAATEEKSEESPVDLGAEPDWLAQAFTDAAQAYGKGESVEKEGPKEAQIVIEKAEETAFFARPEDEVDSRPASSGIFERHNEAKKKDETNTQAQVHPARTRAKDAKKTEPPKPQNSSEQDQSISVGGIAIHWQPKQERYKSDPHIDVSELEALIEKASSSKVPVFHAEESNLPQKHHTEKVADRKSSGKQEIVVKNEKREKGAGQIEERFFEKNPLENDERPGFNFLFQIGKSLGLGITASKRTKGLPSFNFGFKAGNTEDAAQKHLRDLPQTKLREAPQIRLQESQISIVFENIAHWFVETLRNLREPDKLLRAIFSTIIVIAMLLFACDQLIPRNPTVAQVLTEIPLAYRSADGCLQLRLVDSSLCQMKVLGKTSRPRYSLFLSDWRDYIGLPFSALLQKQHWLMRVNGGLKSEEGPMLYYIGGPELQLADYMEHLADESSYYFADHGEYPSKIEDFVPERIAFKNPFASKQELPFVQRLYYDNDKEKKALLSALVDGRPWRGEPMPHEGSIDCCSVTFKTANGLDKLFFLRAYDRKLEPLGGSSPGASHYLLLENGVRSSENTDNVPYQTWSFRPDVFWLLERGDNPISLFFLTYGLAILSGFIALTFFSIDKIAQPEKKSKIFIDLMFKLSVAATVLLVFVRMVP